MYFKYSILALIFSLSCVCLNAQSWKKLKSEADEYFQHEKYKEALISINKALEASPYNKEYKALKTMIDKQVTSN